MARDKEFVYNETTEHGARMAKEAQERVDAKEAFKDEYKTHSMQVSRDDIERLSVVITKHPNAGKFKEIVKFLKGDKGFWTEKLTLEILDNDEQLDDYVNVHESVSDQIKELEAKLKKLKKK